MVWLTREAWPKFENSMLRRNVLFLYPHSPSYLNPNSLLFTSLSQSSLANPPTSMFVSWEEIGEPEGNPNRYGGMYAAQIHERCLNQNVNEVVPS